MVKKSLTQVYEDWHEERIGFYLHRAPDSSYGKRSYLHQWWSYIVTDGVAEKLVNGPQKLYKEKSYYKNLYIFR